MHPIIVLLVIAPLLAGEAYALQPQGPQGPPRRLQNPQNLQLPGGSKVEFRSFHAPSLNRQVHYSIFLPPSYDREQTRHYPVIYFLHGLNNDHTSWATSRYGDVPSLLEKLVLEGTIPEFVMVHPHGENSFYTDYADGTRKYEQYITRDLIEEISRCFRVRGESAGRAIGGTSMGGYGALKIAMKHPALYASAAAASPIVFAESDADLVSSGGAGRRAEFFNQLFGSIYGNPIDREHWRRNNLEYLARNGNLESLNIYMAYGTADRYNTLFPMEAGIRRLDLILRERGLSPVLEIFEGEPHGWELVDKHLPEILSFLTQTF